MAPPKGIFEMSQRLDAGDQFYAQKLCGLIHPAYFGIGVTSAHIAEIRVLRNFIGILCIEHECVHSCRGQLAHEFDYGFRF